MSNLMTELTTRSHRASSPYPFRKNCI